MAKLNCQHRLSHDSSDLQLKKDLWRYLWWKYLWKLWCIFL